MLPIILLPGPQMKRTRLYGLYLASVPGSCGQFRSCGHGRNVFREYARYIETAFARFQNAYRRYREDGALFPDRYRSQQSAPSVKFSLAQSSPCLGVSALLYFSLGNVPYFDRAVFRIKMLYPHARPLRYSHPIFSSFFHASSFSAASSLYSAFQEVPNSISFTPVYTRTSVKGRSNPLRHGVSPPRSEKITFSSEFRPCKNGQCGASSGLES